MEAIIIRAEVNEDDISFIETFFKKIKARKIKIEKEPATYSETLAKKIRKGREEFEKGETFKVNSRNLWEIVD